MKYFILIESSGEPSNLLMNFITIIYQYEENNG